MTDNNDKLVSIIIPVYQAKDTLRECVLSCLDQKDISTDEFEVILIDDGSTDGSDKVCDELASEYEGKVFVVDSLSVALGERILIQLGLQLAERGLSAAEIAAKLDEEKRSIRLLALVDTLEYLKKGGRISAAVALAGGLLGIKPVIAVEQGEVALVGKARGSKQGNNLLRELVSRHGVDFEKPFCLAYSGLTDTLLQKYIHDSAELWQGRTQTLPIATVGCAIDTHVGPGAVAVAFFEK